MRKVYIFILTLLFAPQLAGAQVVATTTLELNICGDGLVDSNEQCDVVPPESGAYSQTIVGRQCTLTCRFGPYCGDGILQTTFAEECDDGNNEDGDFCSATCKVEPAGSGGGGSSGGGSSSGGSDDELGDTLVNITGVGYPRRNITLLLDTESVGTVRVGADGRFEFSTEADPGTATLGLWSTDINGVRSITLNNTFDVTQGAITNISGIILPPTVSVANARINPGETIEVRGQSAPNATVEIHIDDSDIVEEVQSNAAGIWTYQLDTGRLSIAEHIIRARSVTGTPPLTTESSFSTSLQLFVGVDGQATQPSDLNRDTFVNLIDFSILIFWWQSNGGDSDPPADINQNGNVGLEDFSILLFNWTG
jgi:cysteine-rich repeat protein